jgi:hypothetical protein
MKALTKQKKRRKKTKDPPLEAYWAVTGRYPPRASEPLILAANISSKADLEFWRQVIRHWIACGWSPQNLKGMLDYYQERRLPASYRRRRPAGGYRSQHEKGAGHKPNGSKDSGGYRFATLADFGLDNNDGKDGDPEQME